MDDRKYILTHQDEYGRVKVFRGSSNQRGRGIGSFLGGLFRRALPYLSKGARFVGQETLRTGANVLTDVFAHRTPFKQSVKSRLKESVNNIKRKADEKIDALMDGSGYKIKKTSASSHSGSKRRTRKVIKNRKKVNKTRKKKKKKKTTKTVKKNIKPHKRKKIVKKKRQLKDIFI